MHILGKIMIWLTVLAAVAAIYFSTRLLAVRNSWTQQVQKLKQENEANDKTLAQRQREVEELRHRLEHTMLAWGRYWSGVDAQPTAQGTVEAGVGSNQGLAKDEAGTPPLIHSFVLNEDGSSEYAGAFRAATIQPDAAAFVPSWRVRPGDPQRWSPGKWRYRTLIPTPYQSRFVEFDTDFALVDQKLEFQRNNLATQTELADEAQANYDARLAELKGDPVAPMNDSLPPEYTEGLIAVAGAEEAQRDQVWADVDRLRRQRNQLYETMQKLKAANAQLAQRLPQPSASPESGSEPVGGD